MPSTLNPRRSYGTTRCCKVLPASVGHDSMFGKSTQMTWMCLTLSLLQPLIHTG
jgi:hypothetical protein